MKLFWLIIALFFSSGATALVYEVVWSKYLGLIFGSTVQAQAMVLGIFMGGLALGNRIFGRFADGWRRPVAVYGLIEMVIGLFALGFHPLYLAADAVFVRVGAGLLDNGTGLLLLKGAVSLALLLGPTILMGGTLPLLAAWLQRQGGDAGRRAALFYAINSLGAVTGAGLAGFYLVHSLGLVWTLVGTGVVNLLIGVAAVLVSRAQPASALPARPVEKTFDATQASGSGQAALLRSSCLLVFVTGGIAMCLEVLAARALALIFGASLQAFSTMLMAFILGIGLGSMAVALPGVKRFVRPGTVVVLLLGAAAMVAVFLLTIETWTVAYVSWRNRFGATGGGYAAHLVLTAAISIVVLGVPAAFMGAVLPLCIRLVGTASSTLGHHVGRLLTWNTLGAVVGVLLAGFVMMPLLGLHASLAVVAMALCLAALVRSLQLTRLPQAVSGGVLVLIAIVAVSSVERWKRVLTSGVFRWRDPAASASAQIEHEFRTARLLFYKDGADASVAVKEWPLSRGGTQRILTINGKPDASSDRDLSTQYLLAHLPMAARPWSKDVFVLGFGSGITAGALLGHPIERLVVAENCRPVLEASRWFDPWNRGVRTNGLTRLHNEDARTVLKLSPRQYDIIISEPSNPWTAGIGSVFSREFFTLAASRLKPGGMMAQWFHMYEMEDDVVFLVLRTFQSVFPHMEIWETVIGDIVLLGSKEPWVSSPKQFEELYARTEPRRDLEAIGLGVPEALWARQMASQETSFAITGPGPIQSDTRPILEYAATRAFYGSQGAFGLFTFDERTLQSTFAPAEKRVALSALADSVLGPVFDSFPSANPHLMHYYEWRMTEARGKDGREIYFAQPFLNLIFRPDRTYPADRPELPGFSPVCEQMLRAEGLINVAPERWREAVTDLEQLLGTFDPGVHRPEQFPISPMHFAAVGAKACFRNGDVQRAAALARLGLRIAPDDVQLRYIERLLEQAGLDSLKSKR